MTESTSQATNIASEAVQILPFFRGRKVITAPSLSGITRFSVTNWAGWGAVPVSCLGIGTWYRDTAGSLKSLPSVCDKSK